MNKNFASTAILSFSRYMFFILSKTLDVLLLPYTWVVVIACCAVFLKDNRKKRTAGIVLLILLTVLSNTFIVNFLLKQWEQPPQSIASIPDQSTAIILTGITKLSKQPYDRVFFSKGADRVTQALMLYRKGKIKQFIITGGSGTLSGRGRPEALELKKFLLDCQVPASLILIEAEAKNTHENAAFTKQLITQNHLRGPFILITSAFHMNRSMGCFKKENISCIPFPVDYYSEDKIYNPLDYVLPEIGPLQNFTTLTREISGYYIYKVMGYL